MLTIAPANNDCPGCGVACGQPHADRCDFQHCSVSNTQAPARSSAGHDPVKATWDGIWEFPTGVDVEGRLGETSAQQSVPSVLVNLYAALDTWNPDSLCDRPFIVRFNGFEEAKEYVVKNLEDVVQIFAEALNEIRKVNSVEEFERLPIWCTDLITEAR
jgi:hypothetical protein